VDTQQTTPVRVLAIANPEKRNALTPALLEDLARSVRAFGQVPPERESALVLTGRGHGFCAGFDMLLTRDDPGVLGELLTGLAEVIQALRALDKPVVIGAYGYAIAGGCALLGGADVVVTDSAARLGYPVVRLGISPAVSGPTLRAMVDPGRARERMLDPETISGREAAAIGLAHVCVDQPEDVIPKALNIARSLGAKPAGAVAASKRLLREIDGGSDPAAVRAALAASLGLVGSDEQVRRVAGLWKK
jgi:enoyl-CoA hydratase/carnithine racemase